MAVLLSQTCVCLTTGKSSGNGLPVAAGKKHTDSLRWLSKGLEDSSVKQVLAWQVLGPEFNPWWGVGQWLSKKLYLLKKPFLNIRIFAFLFFLLLKENKVSQNNLKINN